MIDADKAIRELLESYFWPKTLEANTRYRRCHDDHDGKFDGWLNVCIGSDGDVWVETTDSLRFRMPLIGGGRSQYTRTALVILAEAIRLDNEHNPIELHKI